MDRRRATKILGEYFVGRIDPGRAPVSLCASVDLRQSDSGEQLLEGGIAVKAGETLVTDEIEQRVVVRLRADGQVLERFARVAEPSFALSHPKG